jgi:hypothetical protein
MGGRSHMWCQTGRTRVLQAVPLLRLLWTKLALRRQRRVDPQFCISVVIKRQTNRLSLLFPGQARPVRLLFPISFASKIVCAKCWPHVDLATSPVAARSSRRSRQADQRAWIVRQLANGTRKGARIPTPMKPPRRLPAGIPYLPIE